jgi:hypothetical protein
MEIAMNTAALVRKFVAGIALLTSVSSAHAIVVFAESGSDTLVKGVLNAAANVHTFTIDTPGTYQASIVDLASLDHTGFSDPFTVLKLAITQLPSSGLFGQAGLPPSSSSFDFSAAKAASFAALVEAVSAGSGFGFYQINITQVGPVPEPTTWVLMTLGVILIGWRHLRKNDRR